VPAVALAVALICGQAAEIKSERVLATILTRSPAPQLVAAGQELQAAEEAAAGLSNATAFLGVGDSMEPLYASNTAVVVVPTKYDRIKQGMTVVYVNSDGFRVAHTVVGETRGGYLVQGLGNDEPDADVVNEDNMIGVIVQAYASTESAYRHEWTLRFLAKGRRFAAK
jgi:hypothetical protein